MEAKKPTVSVVIPTYNSAELLKEAIDSVLVQTYRDYEIIVVDDGSTDNTREVVNSYKDLVRYVYQENSHISVARNHGCSIAKGKYIANLDSDDLWLPKKLEKQMALFEKHPEAGLVYCDGYVRNLSSPIKSDKLISSLYPPPRNGKVFDYIFKASPIPSSAAVFKLDVWKELGGLNTQMRGGQDYEFFVRISAKYPVYACPDPLMIYRFHSSNTSSMINRSNVASRIKRKLQVRHIAMSRVEPSVLTPSIRFFASMPVAVQYLILLYWRLRYGSSKFQVLKSVWQHALKFLPWGN